MNLPNKLTILRMIMIPFFLVALMVPGIPGGKWIALALFCLASLTDMLDGKIARKYNLITDFGKFMDPLADKLLVCSAMIALIDLAFPYISRWCMYELLPQSAYRTFFAAMGAVGIAFAVRAVLTLSLIHI